MLNFNTLPASLIIAVLSVVYLAAGASYAEVTSPGDSSTTVTADAAGSAARTATVTWSPPVENTDGSPLTNLAGYVLFYGTGFPVPFRAIFVDASATELEIQNLSPGNWYFQMQAVNTEGMQSELSPMVVKNIQ